MKKQLFYRMMFLGIGLITISCSKSNIPQEGNRFAAISSGDQLVSEGHSIGNASFWYNFISAEFNDYVDSEFDDCTIYRK